MGVEMRVLALMIALAVAAPALASETPPAAKDADKDKMICKWEPRTGSNLLKKVCLTKGQREQLAAEARLQLRDSLGNNGTAPIEKPIFSGGQ